MKLSHDGAKYNTNQTTIGPKRDHRGAMLGHDGAMLDPFWEPPDCRTMGTHTLHTATDALLRAVAWHRFGVVVAAKLKQFVCIYFWRSACSFHQANEHALRKKK